MKWESITLKVIKGRFLLPFPTAKVLQDHEDRLRALEGESDSSSEPQLRDLSFTITDGANPIEGATVKIGSKTGTTGAAGGCTIKGVEDGKVSVEVSADGYFTKTDEITVSENNVSFTISLTQQGD